MKIFKCRVGVVRVTLCFIKTYNESGMCPGSTNGGLNTDTFALSYYTGRKSNAPRCSWIEKAKIRWCVRLKFVHVPKIRIERVECL